jgi:hypothetical protein
VLLVAPEAQHSAQMIPGLQKIHGASQEWDAIYLHSTIWSMAQNHRPQIILNGSQCVVPGHPKNIQKTLVVPMFPFKVYLL